MLLLLAQSTTTEAPRVVGDHPGTDVVLVAGLALLLVILAAGIWMTRRGRRGEPARREGVAKNGGG